MPVIQRITVCDGGNVLSKPYGYYNDRFLVRVLKAIRRNKCYVRNFRTRKKTTIRPKTVAGVWCPVLQGCEPGYDLQAHSSVRRLLFAVDVKHPEVMIPSSTTVILEQVCIVYSTGTEDMDSG